MIFFSFFTDKDAPPFVRHALEKLKAVQTLLELPHGYYRARKGQVYYGRYVYSTEQHRRKKYTYKNNKHVHVQNSARNYQGSVDLYMFF